MPDSKRKVKPSVSIIGTGRLGTALAVGLAAHGYEIRSLVARRIGSARKAASLVRKTATVSGAEIAALPAKYIASLPPADLFLISVPDDQIATVAAELDRN